MQENQQEALVGLKISAKTWSRDSHGLYDYEATNTRNNVLLISENCKLIRKKHDVKNVLENYELDIDERELGKVNIDNSKIIFIHYFIDKFNFNNQIAFGMQATEININNMQNKIWYVIKQEDNLNNNNTGNNSTSVNSNELYDIKINDVIKLGRVKYAISEINLNGNLESIDKDVKKPVFDLIYDYK
jgi:hypothetical protein